MVLQLTHPRVLCRYSPDENPIEAGFHQWKMKVKRDFHNVAVKSKVELVRVMEESFASISGEDMAPHFKEAGFHSVESRVERDEREALERAAMQNVEAVQAIATLASFGVLALASLLNGV